nr:response regulator [uncultured Trichococcus sp.]
MYNFLIADDEILIRKGTLKKIEKLGLPIQCAFEAGNGKEALTYLEANSIDFVITDMDMPEYDGVQFLDYLKRQFPEMPIIVISGHQNFAYLQKAIQANAINYILKPFSREDIQKSLLDVIAMLEKKKSQKCNENEVIISTIIGHQTELGMKALHKMIPVSNQYYLVLSVCRDPEASLELLDQMAIFSEPIPKYTLTRFSIIEKSKTLALIDSLPESVLLGISSPMKDAAAISSYYQNCIDALNFRKSTSQPAIFYYDSTVRNEKYTFAHIAELMYYLETGKENMLKEKLRGYFETAYFSEGATLFDLKDIGLSLIEKSKQFLDDYYRMQSNYTYPEIHQEVMERLFTFMDISTYFLDFLGNIAKSMSYEHLYSSQDIIANVKDYLDIHFADAITLDFLSDIFYINSSYLSTLFKEKTGMKYVDYLNGLRIDAAKTLLQTTDRRAATISRLVGYDNEKYFYRVFKKFTDLTPEQYRKQK